jgi:hypothetical protein
LAVSNGYDAPGLVDQLVPGITAMIDDLVVGFEDAVGEPIVPHELPDILDGVEFWAFAGSGITLIFSGMMSAAVICHPA